MDIQKITPEEYKKIAEKEREARERRNYTICQMRKTDPDYWTFERLAEHWGMKRQSVHYICVQGGTG